LTHSEDLCDRLSNWTCAFGLWTGGVGDQPTSGQRANARDWCIPMAEALTTLSTCVRSNSSLRVCWALGSAQHFTRSRIASQCTAGDHGTGGELHRRAPLQKSGVGRVG